MGWITPKPSAKKHQCRFPKSLGGRGVGSFWSCDHCFRIWVYVGDYNGLWRLATDAEIHFAANQIADDLHLDAPSGRRPTVRQMLVPPPDPLYDVDEYLRGS